MPRTDKRKASQKAYWLRTMESNPELIRKITRECAKRRYDKNHPVEEQALVSIRKLFVRSNLNDPNYKRTKSEQ